MVEVALADVELCFAPVVVLAFEVVTTTAVVVPRVKVAELNVPFVDAGTPVPRLGVTTVALTTATGTFAGDVRFASEELAPAITAERLEATEETLALEVRAAPAARAEEVAD